MQMDNTIRKDRELEQEKNFKDLIAGNLHHYYLNLKRYLVGLTDGFVLVS